MAIPSYILCIMRKVPAPVLPTSVVLMSSKHPLPLIVPSLIMCAKDYLLLLRMMYTARLGDPGTQDHLGSPTFTTDGLSCLVLLLSPVGLFHLIAVTYLLIVDYSLRYTLKSHDLGA